jgi:hypothetical protein
VCEVGRPHATLESRNLALAIIDVQKAWAAELFAVRFSLWDAHVFVPLRNSNCHGRRYRTLVFGNVQSRRMGRRTNRGPLQIAISTAGYSPALAQRLRRELEDQFGPEYSGWVEQLGRERTQLRDDRAISAEECRQLLHIQASASAYRKFIADRHLTPNLEDAQNGG